MDADFPLQKQNVSSLLPISPFPHFTFLISHFLVPTFRVTREPGNEAMAMSHASWRNVLGVT